MVVINGTTGIDKVQTVAVTFDDMPAGSVIQVANYTTGAYAVGTAIIPFDDTIPQITEGTQFMSLAFTPKKIGSKLLISVTVNMAQSINCVIAFSLFKDADTNAISSAAKYSPAGSPECITFSTYITTVSSLSAITFSIRGGLASACSLYFNGYAGARYLGGSLASSITIEEIAQ